MPVFQSVAVRAFRAGVFTRTGQTVRNRPRTGQAFVAFDVFRVRTVQRTAFARRGIQRVPFGAGGANRRFRRRHHRRTSRAGRRTRQAFTRFGDQVHTFFAVFVTVFDDAEPFLQIIRVFAFVAGGSVRAGFTAVDAGIALSVVHVQVLSRTAVMQFAFAVNQIIALLANQAGFCIVAFGAVRNRVRT